jgi:hypothetical protein
MARKTSSNWKQKIRFGKVSLGNLAAEEGIARACGEYGRSSPPNYMKERREFEKACQEDIKRRDYSQVVVRKRGSIVQ